ncbi:sigma 54-interacting transcriptional regulator [Pseudomonas aeruginosa]|nr:sigma 54-interacting transcriptional regulator [Pseudomonas aeruginosa]
MASVPAWCSPARTSPPCSARINASAPLAVQVPSPRVTGSNNSTARARPTVRCCSWPSAFAASHSTILITGESGTGKELLAQGIR